jgi:hypothetical protein
MSEDSFDSGYRRNGEHLGIHITLVDFATTSSGSATIVSGAGAAMHSCHYKPPHSFNCVSSIPEVQVAAVEWCLVE